MRLICNILVVLCLLLLTDKVSAQNPDILWQKTLANDSIPISSIAIAEGKYVAALKGNEIVILDYTTGDSIKSFPKPADMVGTDIILGKNGERLYVLTWRGLYNSEIFLHSWDITTGDTLINIGMVSYKIPSNFSTPPNSIRRISIASSINGKFIAVGTSNYWDQSSCAGSGGSIRVFNTEDSSIVFQNLGPSRNPTGDNDYHNPKGEVRLFDQFGNGEVGMVKFSPRENFLLHNQRSYYQCMSLGQGMPISNEVAGFVSLSPKKSSLTYQSYMPEYLFSFDEDFLFYSNQIFDYPPTRAIRTFSKNGFVFLPDDNHMLAFKAGGGVAAISNIQQDSWEKVYNGDSLVENIIQVNASRSAFATAANKRITLWKIPTGLQSATLTANYSLSKDTMLIGDTILFSNQTYPFKRGNNYSWNFGDGSAINHELHPNHIFTSPGHFTVTLEVQDTLGYRSTISKQVIVNVFTIPTNAQWKNKATDAGINCISYSNDGRALVAGGMNSVQIWDSFTGRPQKKLSIQTSVYSVRFRDAGNSIAISSTYNRKANHAQKQYIDTYDDAMHIWNSETDSLTPFIYWEKLLFRPELSYLVIKQASATSDFSTDNKYYIAGYRTIIDESKTMPEFPDFFNSTLRLNVHYGNFVSYNFESKKATTHYIGNYQDSNYLRGYYALKIAPDNKYYVTIQERKILGDTSPTLTLKNILTDSILRQIPTTATSMRFSPDKYHLLTSAGLWDVYDSILVKPVTLPQVFEYHPDGIHVFTIRADSSIGIYNLNTTTYEYIYPKQPTTFTCIAVAPDGKHFATGDAKGYITVWNVPDTLKSTVKADFTTLMTKRSSVKTTDTVGFFNTTLPASDNSIYYFWNFGDGTKSNEQSPKHRFMNPGKYTVTLTAFQYGKIMDTAIKAQYITVTGLATEEAQTEIHDNSIRIYPTPSYDETHIHLSLAQAGEYSLIITDNLGREVARWAGMHSAGEETIIWDSVVPSGVYYALFSVGGVVRSVPIVVVK